MVPVDFGGPALASNNSVKPYASAIRSGQNIIYWYGATVFCSRFQNLTCLTRAITIISRMRPLSVAKYRWSWPPQVHCLDAIRAGTHSERNESTAMTACCIRLYNNYKLFLGTCHATVAYPIGSAGIYPGFRTTMDPMRWRLYSLVSLHPRMPIPFVSGLVMDTFPYLFDLRFSSVIIASIGRGVGGLCILSFSITVA